MGEPSSGLPGQLPDSQDNKGQPNAHQPPAPAQPPPPGYQQPPPGYGQPHPGYGYNQPPPGYHQPPPGYGQPVTAQPMQPAYASASQQSTVVVTNQPASIHIGGYSYHAQAQTCPFCQANIVTSVSYEAGTATFVFSGVICFIGCWAGCCLIPCCMDSTKDAVHSCPNCKRQLGRKNRF